LTLLFGARFYETHIWVLFNYIMYYQKCINENNQNFNKIYFGFTWKKKNLILKKPSKYKFDSLWCVWTWTRTHDLPQMMLAHQPLHHRCGFMYTHKSCTCHPNMLIIPIVYINTFFTHNLLFVLVYCIEVLLPCVAELLPKMTLNNKQ
jgi:hypothetical protein